MYQEDNYLPINCHLYSSNDTFDRPNSNSNSNSSSSSSSNQNIRRSVLHCTEEMIENLTDRELEHIKTRCKDELQNIPPVEPSNHWASPEIMNQIRNMKYFPDAGLNELMIKLMLRVGSFRQSVTHTIVIFLSSESFKQFYLPNQIIDETKRSKATRLPHPWYKLFHLFWQQFDLSPELSVLFKKVINEACYKLSFVPEGEWKGKFRGKWCKDRQNNSSNLNALYGMGYHEDDDVDESSGDNQFQNKDSCDEGSFSGMSFEVLSDDDYVPPTNSVPPLNAVFKCKKKPRLEPESSISSEMIVPIENRTSFSSPDFFTQEEMDQIKERLRTELSFERIDNCPHWASRNTQNRIRQLNFFPDSDLNSRLSELLLKIHSYRTVIFSTMVVFYGHESFKKFYLPRHIETVKNSTALKPPLPKYKLFHEFWHSVHGPGATPLKFKRLLTTGNYHLKRVPDGKWKGSVVSASYAVKAAAKSKQRVLINKIKQRCKLTRAPNVQYSVQRHQVSTSNNSIPKLTPLSPSKQWPVPSTSGRDPFFLPQLVPLTDSPSSQTNSNSNSNSFIAETGDYLHDENGNTYIRSKNGNRLYVYIESSINISFDQFFQPTRLLLMKVRAWTILHRSAFHLLNQDLMTLPKRMKYAPEATNKILNLNYFPDAKLNELMIRILFADHSITRQVKWTAAVFWSEQELAGSAMIPGVMPFIRIHHEPIIGYFYFHQFWDFIFGSSKSEERRRTLRSAIGEVYRDRGGYKKS